MQVVIITGTRHGVDPNLIRPELESLPRNSIIVEGGYNGVDSQARQMGHDLGLQVITVWANWKGHGPSAGPRRNQLILDLFKDEDIALLLAFPAPDSKGTIDMIERASNRKISMRVIGSKQ